MSNNFIELFNSKNITKTHILKHDDNSLDDNPDDIDEDIFLDDVERDNKYNNKKLELLSTDSEYSRLIQFKRYFVSPYVYIRLICEKYLYNFGSNNDISQINDHIYIGNYSTSTNLELLKKNGITHIITALSSFNPPFPNDFTYFHAAAYDDLNEDLICNFFGSNTFIHNAIVNKGKIYIHCMCGVSRSVAIALAYILFVRQFSNETDTYHKIIDRKLKQQAELNNNQIYKDLIEQDEIYSKINIDIVYELVKIKERRSVANPNKSFLKQLNKFYYY